MQNPRSFSGFSPNLASPVAVIGAGSSGLTVLKALREAGVPAVGFESGSRVGGNWLFGNDNGQSNIYRSLRINTSRDRMQFSDFPMPRDYPDYPGHELIARYFQAYATAFELEQSIRFRTRVEHVNVLEGGRTGFELRLSTGETESFRAVVVANGHHWDPALPDPYPPGEFSGVTLHSHAYVSPEEPVALGGRRVLVVGIGNSAVDIACELARAGSTVSLSVRRGAWVLPRYVFGKPLDQGRLIPASLPDSWKAAITELWYRFAIGRPADYGLPEPDHRLGHAHPTVSSDLLPLLRERRLSVRPPIRRFHGGDIEFEDGERAPFDAVVFATGYHVSFPFFDREVVSAPNNELLLYRRCFHLDIEGLMFAGLCQPLGAIMPIAEEQGRLFAAYASGRYALPDRAVMQDQARREREAVRQKFVASRRHTMQVDFARYLAELRREQAEGAARARSRRAATAT